MSREREVDTNGARIFRDLSRDPLDSSKIGIVTLGQRTVTPTRATQENFKEKLRAWEEHVERYARVSDTTVHESLKPIGNFTKMRSQSRLETPWGTRYEQMCRTCVFWRRSLCVITIVKLWWMVFSKCKEDGFRFVI